MSHIESAIQLFLENIENTEVSDTIIEEFGENCKKAIRECLLTKRNEEPFKLRMSNIGKPLRQLMLEKLFGRVPMDSQQRLRMTYGYIYESFVLFLLKAAGLKIETNKKVALDIAYDTDNKYTLLGSLDLKIDGKIYDIKSASSWSFDNKFTSFDNMEKDDPFGYCGQAMAYSLGDKSLFGGWIVVDKADGRIKVVEVPEKNYRDIARKYLDDFKEKIKKALFGEVTLASMPPCDGVIEETFGKYKTGNLILNKSCEFCPHKYKCHPELKFKEDVNSKAAKKTWKYYVKLDRPK